MAPHMLLERAHFHWTIELKRTMRYIPRFSIVRLIALRPPPLVIRGPRPGRWGSEISYAYHPTACITDNDCFVKYGRVHRPGDVIGVHVDNVRGTIEFTHNGKALGVAYRNVAMHLKFIPTAFMQMQQEKVQKVEENLQFKCYRLLQEKFSHEQILLLLPQGMKNELRLFEFLSKFSGKPFKIKAAPTTIRTGNTTLRNPSCTVRLQPPVSPVGTKLEIGEVLLKSNTSVKSRRLKNARPKRLGKAKKCPCCGKANWCK